MDNISFSRAVLSSFLQDQNYKKCLPKRLKKFKNVRVIIHCLELFIQKPKVPSSQKITCSNYKHWNTAKLLVGITQASYFNRTVKLWNSVCTLSPPSKFSNPTAFQTFVAKHMFSLVRSVFDVNSPCTWSIVRSCPCH